MPFIGTQPVSGLFLELDALTASATADYTLQLNSANYSPESVNNLLVSINGVIQGSSTMSLNGAVLTVGATLSSSDTIDFVRVFGNVGTVSTPTDGSVTANKIGTGAVTSAKIADGTIVNADINASAGIAGSKLGTSAVVQVKYDQTVALDTTATQLPRDDTIPQNDEGKEFMSLAITPISSSSDLIIETELNLDTTVTNYMTVALFQDNNVNAIAASFIHMSGVEHTKRIHLKFKMTAGTTSSTTFKVRAGLSAAGTVTLNGTNSSRFLGGVCTSYMQITEIGG
jgi:hypothetical protein